jgi:hypothetical protein
MKKMILGGVAAVLFAAAPALAGHTTIQLTRDSGESFTVVLNSDGTASVNGGAAETYTWDETTNMLCAASGLCVTFAEASNEVGFTTTYTTNQGNAGTATLTERVE